MQPVSLFAFHREFICLTNVGSVRSISRSFSRLHQRSSRMRKRSSTSVMTSCDSMPHREVSRSFETERIASHRTTLSFLVPPSPFLTFTCSGISRLVEVSGKTTTSSAGPALGNQLREQALVCAQFVPGHGSAEDRQARSRLGADKPYGIRCRRLAWHLIAAAPPARLPKPSCSGAVLNRPDWFAQGADGVARFRRLDRAFLAVKYWFAPPFLRGCGALSS